MDTTKDGKEAKTDDPLKGYDPFAPNENPRYLALRSQTGQKTLKTKDQRETVKPKKKLESKLHSW
jgi:hypothetical protein